MSDKTTFTELFDKLPNPCESNVSILDWLNRYTHAYLDIRLALSELDKVKDKGFTLSVGSDGHGFTIEGLFKLAKFIGSFEVNEILNFIFQIEDAYPTTALTDALKAEYTEES